MAQKTHYFAFKGGLDLVTPSITKPEGALIQGLNYEPVSRGYRRVDGYERFDGQPQPSQQQYWTLAFTSGQNEPTVGYVVTGATSGATGVVVDVVVSSGSWAGNDAVGYIVIRLATGTYSASENITLSAPVSFDSGFTSGFY